MADRAYDEETFSAEEEAALKQFELDSAAPPPPAEDDDENSPSVARVAAEAGLDPETGEPIAKKPDQAPAPADDQQQQPPADPQRAAFLERHKDKTPEQLAELLYQQSKRANAEGFRARKTGEQLSAVLTQAQQRLADRKADIERRRGEFDKQLEDDPDAATRRVFNEKLDAELEAAEAEALTARIDTAIELASTAIPNFHQHAPQAYAFGQEMNYTPEELNNITDGRDLVVLHFATRFGRMVQAGICDVEGNFIQPPAALAETVTDPRLKAPDALSTLSSAPARSGGTSGLTGKVQALENALSLSDEDFDKLTPAQIDEMMRGIN